MQTVTALKGPVARLAQTRAQLQQLFDPLPDSENKQSDLIAAATFPRSKTLRFLAGGSSGWILAAVARLVTAAVMRK
jgi:hypothetical protein